MSDRRDHPPTDPAPPPRMFGDTEVSSPLFPAPHIGEETMGLSVPDRIEELARLEKVALQKGDKARAEALSALRRRLFELQKTR